MEQIIVWNNRAVALLAEGLENPAERMFCMAMTSLNSHAHSTNVRSQQISVQHALHSQGHKACSCLTKPQRTSASDAMDLDDQQLVEGSVQVLDLGEFNDPKIERENDIGLPLYNRAIFISSSAGEHEIGGALLYNWALIQQKRGRLEKAVKLYQLALQILQATEDGAVDELLIMAPLYNMGLAHGQLAQTEQLASCFYFLRQVLCDANLLSGNPNLPDPQSEDGEEYFFLNAFLFKAEQLTLAPAA